MNSAFRVILVDNYGYLLDFLRKAEAMVEEMQANNQTPLLSVDFEGTLAKYLRRRIRSPERNPED